jgi:ribosomal protein S18 acetylase RimI-like enzyme
MHTIINKSDHREEGIDMTIRKANKKDIGRLIDLLEQVLEIHAIARPDIFISGTTKYTHDELKTMVEDDTNPIYVAVDADDIVVGYAFCQLKQPHSNCMAEHKTLYIDDLCVDEKARGQHVGESLFEYVKEEAKKIGCSAITLNVWRGNDSAECFYEKMGMSIRSKTMEFLL